MTSFSFTTSIPRFHLFCIYQRRVYIFSRLRDRIFLGCFLPAAVFCCTADSLRSILRFLRYGVHCLRQIFRLGAASASARINPWHFIYSFCHIPFCTFHYLRAAIYISSFFRWSRHKSAFHFHFVIFISSLHFTMASFPLPRDYFHFTTSFHLRRVVGGSLLIFFSFHQTLTHRGAFCISQRSSFHFVDIDTTRTSRCRISLPTAFSRASWYTDIWWAFCRDGRQACVLTHVSVSVSFRTWVPFPALHGFISFAVLVFGVLFSPAFVVSSTARSFCILRSLIAHRVSFHLSSACLFISYSSSFSAGGSAIMGSLENI